jgi:multiple sugar transport system permease protein
MEEKTTRREIRLLHNYSQAKARSDRKDRMRFFLFISPWLIGLAVFEIIPMLMSFYYSFTDWDVLSKANYVGMENYTGLFEDPLFYQSLKVTLVYTALTVPMLVFLSLLVAMLLNVDFKYIGLFRVIYYLPAVLPGVVYSITWRWIFNSKFGLLNSILELFGVESPRWLSDPKWTMPAMVIMSVIGVGGSIIMYLAGLQAVPQDLYKAARIDAAGYWSRLRYITIPAMSPIILFTLLTNLIGSLQTFTVAYIMTEGGPDNASLFYAYYLYNNGFQYRKMGKACAMAWLLFVVILILSILVLKVSNKMTYYESEDGGEIV